MNSMTWNNNLCIYNGSLIYYFICQCPSYIYKHTFYSVAHIMSTMLLGVVRLPALHRCMRLMMLVLRSTLHWNTGWSNTAFPTDIYVRNKSFDQTNGIYYIDCLFSCSFYSVSTFDGNQRWLPNTTVKYTADLNRSAVVHYYSICRLCKLCPASESLIW